MMTTTPIGVLTFRSLRPLGRTRSSSTRPTGSGRAATSRRPLAIAAMRLSSSFGERAGLVGAEHVHSAEVLNGVETLHDYLLAAHGERALGQADGDNHGQHLRGHADGNGHSEEKFFFPIVLGKPVDEED